MDAMLCLCLLAPAFRFTPGRNRPNYLGSIEQAEGDGDGAVRCVVVSQRERERHAGGIQIEKVLVHAETAAGI